MAGTDIPLESLSACYLCGSEGSVLHHRLKDLLYGANGEWDLKICKNPDCGLVWLDPRPTEKVIGKVYAKYYTHDLKGDKDSREGVSQYLVRKCIKFFYSIIKQAALIKKGRKRIDVMYLDDIKPGRLLEIGCGNGDRLIKIRRLGWGVEGQEIDPVAVSTCLRKHPGLEVSLGGLRDLSYPDGAFDAIIMNHVIEHLHDPMSLLKECLRILKKGGALVLATPNINSFGHRYFKSAWRGLEPPRHLYIFSTNTLKKLAENAGFDRFKTWTTPDRAESFALGSLDIQQHKTGPMTKLKRYIMAIIFQIKAKFFHVSDPGSGEECVLIAFK
ncbi:class I SAM-dependent methyltransferase [Dissulfurimicrobium hydrothermale]|uniref:class I SAM-dependent methyltransferase n=1 Tax=Dissulfurimicrobium hydrothermale TaxID=1750598 RepID=UPI001EDC48A8|nr:class I SAM-dependent methyltransferase [Dissulfurimicrobium hydrothermale]UKL13131.1 class I SAM-dependent methyltransferase [Dissulfurimicrobium hydrothermale]